MAALATKWNQALFHAHFSKLFVMSIAHLHRIQMSSVFAALTVFISVAQQRSVFALDWQNLIQPLQTLL